MRSLTRSGSGNRYKRGFSLVEVIFTLLLVAILLGLTGVTLRSGVDKEGSRGLAYTLASDLRAARTEALRSGKLVAVCFPSNGKTNSISRSAILRKGQQRGHISRLLSYGNEYDAYIFTGKWSGAAVSTHELPDSWPVSTKNETAIMFTPDGHAFSNDIAALDGNYPIVVGTSFQGELSGPNGTLSAALNPHTVWVSAAGSISVEERKLPVGTLPVGRSELVAAEPDLSKEPSPKSPVVENVKFYPEKVDGLDTAYIGQNFVNIHPNQKDGAYLEYGMATIDLRATDGDGGPLTYTLEAKASGDEKGEFTVSNLKGQMEYIFDEDRNKYLWHALISWRPPPDSPANLVYQLAVTVQDPEGNFVVIDSGAGLLPKITSLPPTRMVVCTGNKELYLANLDGKNEIHLNKSGKEYRPLFSADGSRLYSFHDPAPQKRQLRSRPADGSTGFQMLASYDTEGTSKVQIDPTSTLATITNGIGKIDYPYDVIEHVIHTSTDSDGNTTSYHAGCYRKTITGINLVETFKIDVVNLLTNERREVTDRSWEKKVEWSDEIKHNFSFEKIEIAPLVKVGPVCEGVDPNTLYRPHPAYVVETNYRKVEGYPSQVVTGQVFTNHSQGRVYNPANPNWFIQVDKDDSKVLQLGRVSPSSLSTLYTASAPIENDQETRLMPAWSADGQWVAFVVKAGGSSTAVAMRALNSGYTSVGSPSPSFTYSGGGVSSAQLGPEGQWVYFLQNNKIMRADNKASAAPVDISSHFAGGVSSYVLSP